MNDATSQKCPQCGMTFHGNVAGGLCPGCLMALNLKTETVFTGTASASQPTLPPEEIAPYFPQLEILECLGRGGMGVVYKARQKTLNRVIALKLLAPERVADAKFAERFAHEARALAALNHPNIVTIYDFGQAGGFYFLLMEFVDGVNLRQLLRARKLTPEEALAIVPPLCDALQFAHDRGIVHRDIKPENLLLDKSGKVKVADFGIAKMLGPINGEGEGLAAGAEHATRSIVGTPGYSAPEQKTDPQRVDSRADIYSLGVVFYEMLTGELPGNRIEPPSRKVQIDVRLDELVLRALETKPELRFQQASDVKTMAETIAGSPANFDSRAFHTNRIYHGMDYRTKATLWGLPLLHVTSGIDPQTGKVRVSKGIIAIGGKAKGIVAIGGLAQGGIAFGGCAMGVFSFGGCSIGLVALGGLAVALLAAVGGGAIAPIAIGGCATGYLAFGGQAIGAHVWDAADQQDAIAGNFFQPWLNFIGQMQWIILLFVLFMVAISVGVPLLLAQRVKKKTKILAASLVGLIVFSVLLLDAVYLYSHYTHVTNTPMTAAAQPGLGTGPVDQFVHSPPSAISNAPSASAETWEPSTDPGVAPKMDAIQAEIKSLMDEGRYEQALQRQIWYFNHALQNGVINPVRLSFGIMHWAELSRCYPKAKQALLEIRDKDTRKFAERGGYFDLFLEVANINRTLEDQEDTYTLFKQIQNNDPHLAQQCYGVVEDLLASKGEYALCMRYIGDPELKFENIRNQWRMQLATQSRTAASTQPKDASDKEKVSPSLPDSSEMIKKFAHDRFVAQTRQLIEILVGGGDKADAEKIQDEAVAVLDDPQLHSAVSDAEKKVAK